MRTIRYHNNYGTARIYLLGVIGTVVEWYDFAIYGHLSIFGGGAMLISSLLTHWLHNPLAPAFYLMTAATLSLTALFLLRHWKNV